MNIGCLALKCWNSDSQSLESEVVEQPFNKRPTSEDHILHGNSISRDGYKYKG